MFKTTHTHTQRKIKATAQNIKLLKAYHDRKKVPFPFFLLSAVANRH